MELIGKRILISGGTTGIGKECALKLASEGAEIFIFGRESKDLAKTLKEIENVGGRVMGITADASKKEGVKKVFDEVKRAWKGELDVLVNCVGVGGGDFMADYDKSKYMIDTNLFAYIAFAKEAVKIMSDAGGGHIISIGSMSAETADAGSEVYNASKAGIRSFFQSLRKRVNNKGIKISVIEPGATGTEMTEMDKKGQAKMQKDLKMLKPGDVAETVAFILKQPPRVDIILLQLRAHLQEI
jgi:short-subunit dehydrogenase